MMIASPEAVHDRHPSLEPHASGGDVPGVASIPGSHSGPPRRPALSMIDVAKVTQKRRGARDIYFAILSYVKQNGPSTKSKIMRANNLEWFSINQHLFYLGQVGFIERIEEPRHFSHPKRELYRITFDGEKYFELLSELIRKEGLGCGG